MSVQGLKTSIKHWSTAWIAAAAFHSALIVFLAFMIMSDGLVRVVQTVPAPDETVYLLPAQAIQAAVYFNETELSFNPEAAVLYRIEDDGSRTRLGNAHLHQKRRFAVQFDGISSPGTYEIIVNDGENGIVSKQFDGEYQGQFPSGDKTAGGAFAVQFKIASKQQEVMTASLYDPQKPEENEEPAAAQAVPKLQTPQPPTPIAEPPKTKPTKTPKPPKRQPQKETPSSPHIQEQHSPVTGGRSADNEPSPIVISPENLRVSPLNMAPELMMHAAAAAEENFRIRDTSKMAAAANLEKKRFDAAYNAEGPVIGIGRQGNAVSHSKDVAEFLALMHKQVHPLWALGYLLRLDTVYRGTAASRGGSELEAVLEITLDSFGAVSDVRVVKSSGITDYDSEAIHVAWNSSPGIAPPETMRSKNGKSYVHWTFWRDSRMCGVFGVKVFKLEGSAKDAVNFSLKAVQLQERKLGLNPSTVPIPGIKGLSSEPQNDPKPAPEPLPERINPLED